MSHLPHETGIFSVLLRIVTRNPFLVWLCAIPVWLVCIVVTMIHQWSMRTVLNYLHNPDPAGLLWGTTTLAVLTVPQSNAIHLPGVFIVFSLLVLMLFTQYCTALWIVSSPPILRTTITVVLAWPNLCLTVYMGLLCALYFPGNVLGALSLRQRCWTLYSMVAPVWLLPQVLFLIVWHIVSTGLSGVVAS